MDSPSLWPYWRECQRDSDRQITSLRAHRLNGSALSQVQMVGNGADELPVVQPRCMTAGDMPEQHVNVRLIERNKVLKSITQAVSNRRGVVRESLSRISRRPASQLIQTLRKVPVKQRGVRSDTSFEERVG